MLNAKSNHGRINGEQTGIEKFTRRMQDGQRKVKNSRLGRFLVNMVKKGEPFKRFSSPDVRNGS